MPDAPEIIDQTSAILSQTNFTTFDWVIVILYPMISLIIGLVVRKYVKNMSDFVCAGRGLGTCLGIATMTGTEMGLITVMYSAQKGFGFGFAALHIGLVAGVVTFIVGVSGFFVYRLREMEVLTIPEFYEQRFGRKTRILGGIMMALGGILNMGLFLKVGSQFIVAITGMSDHPFALKAVMTFLIVMVLLYTCLGGMISVVISDYVQFVVLSFGLLLTTYLAIDFVGWDNLFSTIQTEMGAKGFDPTVGESDFGYDYIVWMAFMGLVSCGIWPTAVARALAMKNPQAVKRQYMWSSISFGIRLLIPCFWGICAYVFIMSDAPLKDLFFPAGYPPPEGFIGGEDSITAMPLFLGRILHPGLIGLITAAMVAAFMSTHDSYLLCWSSVLTQDVVGPILGKKMTPERSIFLTRSFIVILGIWVLAWGLFYEGTDDIWEYMNITGAIYFSGAFALLLGGLYWKRASSTGAVLALIAGFSAIIGLSPVQALFGKILTSLGNSSENLFDLFTKIPYVTTNKEVLNELIVKIPTAPVGLTSIALTVLALVFGSLLFPDKKTNEANSLSTHTGGA